MAVINAPFYPIIYVRGYAMRSSDIQATTATPYMGFNAGSTRLRQRWDGDIDKHYFESPLIRLFKDYGYQDAYADGQQRIGRVDPKTIFIHRYYDAADPDFGGDQVPSIEQAAADLRDRIAEVRNLISAEDADALKRFRVYLVAHSMGGLICRTLLQNEQLRDTPEAKQVDKVFTYATPHNGIEIAGLNVPGLFGLWDINNFNRKRMAKYLSLGRGTRVCSLDGQFDPKRFFCLIGTNHRDYDAAAGVSRKLAGPMSDGLVRIKDAVAENAPRAFVHRTHGGNFGIVNSEEGYQNLTRFLFGDIRVDGLIETQQLPLPPSIQAKMDEGHRIRAGYYFEATVAPRGAMSYTLSERTKGTFSAVLRQYDELMLPEKAGLDAPRWPHLFSCFLDTARITRGKTVVFSLDLAVSATEYEIDGNLFTRRRIPGEFLYRDTLCIRATRNDQGWRIRYNRMDEHWAEKLGIDAEQDAQGVWIPLSSKKGFRGKLRLDISAWA